MMIGDPSLHENQHDPTLPGQAHFADFSIGATCGECLYFVPKPFVQIKRFCCSKAKVMSGKWLKPIPANAIACKYFQRRT
jgi:hypothetical protein